MLSPQQLWLDPRNGYQMRSPHFETVTPSLQRRPVVVNEKNVEHPAGWLNHC